MNCRFCRNPLQHEFINLGNSPPSNSYLTKEQLDLPEIFYPLKLLVCDQCFLVQIDEYKKSAEIFDENYAYYSSFSSAWLDHAKRYVEMATDRFQLNEQSNVLEIASNDGYLLQYFKAKQIPTLGIEPAKNVARVAMDKGIESITEFFGLQLAEKLINKNYMADLIIGNNVFAHVPDINDFVEGLKTILKPTGIITLEFPHLMQLFENNQFDTIYHEHFSYYSFFTAKQILEKYQLDVFDVEQLPTHGGSLRVFAKHRENSSQEISCHVDDLLNDEERKGMKTLDYYKGFHKKVDQIKIDLIDFLLTQKKNKMRVAAYGAAAKGNTLLNYCGIKNDLIEFVVDASPHKQGMYLPASHIPIVNEETLKNEKPDYILVLPWNLKEEIINQLHYAREWGAQFVLPIPQLEIIE